MALAICHKSHMANEGEGETQRLSSSNSSTNEDNARVATHTHRQWQNKETNSAHFESFVVSFYVLFAVRVKCNKQTTNERKNEQSNDEQIDNMPPTPTPTLTPNAHAHMVQYKLLLCHISFFFAIFVRFCSSIFHFSISTYDWLPPPNIPSYLFLYLADTCASTSCKCVLRRRRHSQCNASSHMNMYLCISV